MVRWTMIALAALVVVGAAATLWETTPARADEPVAESSVAAGPSGQACPCNRGSASVGYAAAFGSPYPCVRQVPPWVGYTYITDPRLDPGAFYPHHYRYVQPGCGGKTVTRVSYRRGCL